MPLTGAGCAVRRARCDFHVLGCSSSMGRRSDRAIAKRLHRAIDELAIGLASMRVFPMPPMPDCPMTRCKRSRDRQFARSPDHPMQQSPSRSLPVPDRTESPFDRDRF
jgi:hypothetical protein